MTVLTPPVLPAGFAATALCGLLRVLGLLRLAPVARHLLRSMGSRYAALLAFVTVVAGGNAFAAVEKKPDEWDGI